MSFVGVLNRLVESSPGGLAALFLDESGEVVEMVSTDLPEEEIRVVGAYLGIHLRQIRRVLEDAHAGSPEALHLEKDALHVHALPLPEGYYLVLVQRRPAPVAIGRRRLVEAADALRQEAFS